MSLRIELDETEVEPRETIRGRLHGLDAWPEAREYRVALRHRGEHLQSSDGEEIGIAPDGSGEAAFALTVPAEAYPTFEGEHYVSRWVVEAIVDRPRKSDVRTEREVVVGHAPVPEPASDSERAEWGGYRRFRQFLAVFAVADLMLLAGVWIVVGHVPPAALFAFLAPAVLSLAALAFLAVAGTAIDRLEICLPRRSWRFGETVPVEITLEAEPDVVAALSVTLSGEEVWVTSSGQTTTTHRETVHEEIRRIAGADLRGARVGTGRWSWRVDLCLPASGPPSLDTDVRWCVRVAAELPRRPDPVASIDLEVAGRVPDR